MLVESSSASATKKSPAAFSVEELAAGLLMPPVIEATWPKYQLPRIAVAKGKWLFTSVLLGAL